MADVIGQLFFHSEDPIHRLIRPLPLLPLAILPGPWGVSSLARWEIGLAAALRSKSCSWRWQCRPRSSESCLEQPVIFLKPRPLNVKAFYAALLLRASLWVLYWPRWSFFYYFNILIVRRFTHGPGEFLFCSAFHSRLRSAISGARFIIFPYSRTIARIRALMFRNNRCLKQPRPLRSSVHS